jgi:uncharacterized protein with HEPN domain
MKRDYKLYLNDIKESIVQIEKYISGKSEEDFKKDKLLQDGIMKRLEIIGEASRNIPRVLKERNKHIPWFELSNFRDFLAHSYFDASLKRIWEIVKTDIPKIKEGMKSIVLV